MNFISHIPKAVDPAAPARPMTNQMSHISPAPVIVYCASIPRPSMMLAATTLTSTKKPVTDMKEKRFTGTVYLSILGPPR